MNKMEILEPILDEYVRPKLGEHGGNIVITNIKDDVAYIKLTGHCSGCPSAKYTLEDLVKEEVLKHTDCITDILLQEEVSEDLINFAKELLAKGR